MCKQYKEEPVSDARVNLFNVWETRYGATSVLLVAPGLVSFFVFSFVGVVSKGGQ